MTNQTTEFQLLCGEDLEVGIKSHEKIVIGVFVKDTCKGLLVHGRSKAVRQNHMSTCRVGKTAHFEQTNLIKTSGKDIDNMAVVGNALGKVLVELESLLVVLDVVAVDIVVRSNGLTELGSNNHTRTLGRRATTEQHDTGTLVHELCLQKSSSNTERNAGTPQRALVVCDGPGVSLKGLEGVGQLEFALRHGEDEARAGSCWGCHGRSARLLWNARSRSHLAETKHLVDLLGGVVLATAEDIGLGALGVTQLMNLSLELLASHENTRIVPLTIVPYVMRPTEAYAGSRLRLMMIESLRAFRLSSSWHVSTTKRKMGGVSTGWGRRYSMVVLAACSSGGICCSEMSL